jgi:hypothetical protein
MDPFELMTKSAKFNFASLSSVLKALHSGARAQHAGARIAHANKMIGKYQGNKGMGWRVNSANKSLAKNIPKQQAYQQSYDDLYNTLTPGQQRAMRYGKSALTGVYDLPKMLLMAPTSTSGWRGSLGVYTGAGLMGYNIDPYSRAGQLHGLSKAKDIATEYGTQGGYQAANDLLTGFDSLGLKDRMSFAKNPNALLDSVTPPQFNPSGSKFNLEKFIKGTPDYLDNAITSGISEQVNNFKI